jgi:hypothetical protein
MPAIPSLLVNRAEGITNTGSVLWRKTTGLAIMFEWGKLRISMGFVEEAEKLSIVHLIYRFR